MDEAKRSIQESQDLGQWPTGARRTFTASGWRKFQAKIRSQSDSEQKAQPELSNTELESQ